MYSLWGFIKAVFAYSLPQGSSSLKDYLPCCLWIPNFHWRGTSMQAVMSDGGDLHVLCLSVGQKVLKPEDLHASLTISIFSRLGITAYILSIYCTYICTVMYLHLLKYIIAVILLCILVCISLYDWHFLCAFCKTFWEVYICKMYMFLLWAANCPYIEGANSQVKLVINIFLIWSPLLLLVWKITSKFFF